MQQKAYLKVRISYEDISQLRKVLRNDNKLNAYVGRPKKAPQNKKEKVNIPIEFDSQGETHVETIIEIINQSGGEVTSKIVQGELKFRHKARDYFRRSGLPIIGAAGAAAVEETLRNWSLITAQTYGIENLAISVIFGLIIVAGVALAHLRK